MRDLIANLKHAARNRETVNAGGGIFSPEEIAEAVSHYEDTRADMLEALYMALPFVEDHEASDIYKTGAVTKALNTIRAAIKQAEGIA